MSVTLLETKARGPQFFMSERTACQNLQNPIVELHFTLQTLFFFLFTVCMGTPSWKDHSLCVAGFGFNSPLFTQ